MKSKSLLMTIAILIIAMNLGAQVTGTFTDSRDGKTYKNVKIGTQTWMAENLRHKANSGCWVYDNDQRKVATYGFLYDWETAKVVCPVGWHLPSDAEWTTLTTYLGGESVAGGKLKETSTTHWNSPNKGATNETGFTALPGGGRIKNGSFSAIGSVANWWSSTDRNSTGAWGRYIFSDGGDMVKNSSHVMSGFAVRCVKD